MSNNKEERNSKIFEVEGEEGRVKRGVVAKVIVITGVIIFIITSIYIMKLGYEASKDMYKSVDISEKAAQTITASDKQLALVKENAKAIADMQQTLSNLKNADDENAKAIADIQQTLSELKNANDENAKAIAEIQQILSNLSNTDDENNAGAADNSTEEVKNEQDNANMNEEPKPIKEENKNEASEMYSRGTDCMYFYDVRKEVQKLYKEDKITYEQLSKYVDSYLNLFNLAASGDEITKEAVENYNNIIKGMYLIDYEKYYIKSTEKDYLKGFRDKILYNICLQVVVKYYEEGKIPDNVFSNYDSEVVKANKSKQEKDITRIIRRSKSILSDYVGSADEILKSDSWRNIKSVETFLSTSF